MPAYLYSCDRCGCTHKLILPARISPHTTFPCSEDRCIFCSNGGDFYYTERGCPGVMRRQPQPVEKAKDHDADL